MRTIMVVFFVLIATICTAPGFCALPVVENVLFSQRVDGSGLVDLTYDLIHADGDTCAVTLQVSYDYGLTWDFPVLDTSGDIGHGVVPGLGKTAVWNVGGTQDRVIGEGFIARVVASDAGVTYAAHSPRNVAITDFSSIDWTDPAAVEKFSRADICLLMGHHLWKGGNSANLDIVAQLKALNPDIVVLGYVSVKSAHMSGLTSDPESYWYNWYHRTEPYFMVTTEGAIAQDWPNSRLINILEPGCRKVMIETIIEMQANSLNVFDGVYWDYFNNNLWIPDFMEIAGDPDLDNDGIPHASDPDELQAYQDAQVSLVHALRDSLGEDFIQFFNGQRAYGDMEFASLADGAMYELFPTLFFPTPDMAYAMDPEYEFSLMNVRPFYRTQNGGPFLVFANPWENRYLDHNREVTDLILGDLFRAVALVTDTYSSWNVGSFAYGWTEQDIALGAAVGPPVFDGVFIRRNFEYGDIEIEMTSGAYPNPFDYRIHILGTLVEELAVPYHYP